ncbi:beta-1,3-galactosyltransferase 5-like, partial [Ixodes scapularis]|uniref:beta-1,3-galactosyltransferase 5-like n=1 Tax=Ixodes scapularis TaxID=6945 RepID=UPI001A9DE01A
QDDAKAFLRGLSSVRRAMVFRRSRKLCCVLVAALGTVMCMYALQLHRTCAPSTRNVTLNESSASCNTTNFWNPEEILRNGYEELPFPVEDTGHLPDAHYTASACRKKPRYLFFIHTAPGHFRHRAIIRGCLKNGTFSSYYRWTTVFFVGLSSDNDTAKQVEEEASQHGDVVVLPYRDAYRNLTYKFVYGMKWVIENCPAVEYILKMDDDMAANISMLMNYLSTRPQAQKPECHCLVYENVTVIRDVKSKWYIPEKIYPNKTFPRYCAGGAAFFNASALRSLYNASFSLPFHPIDDVYVTGDGFLKTGVQLVDIKKLVAYEGNDWWGVTLGKRMFSHLAHHELRVLAWRLTSEGLAKTIRAATVNKTKS